MKSTVSSCEGAPKRALSRTAKVFAGAVAAAFLLFVSVILVQIVPYENAQETSVEPIGLLVEPGADALIDANANEVRSIAVNGRFDRALRAGDQVFFFSENLEVRLFLNGEEVYAFGAPDDHPSSFRSSGSGWGRFVVPRDTAVEDAWTVELSNAYSNNYAHAYRDFLESLTTGDSGALARMVLSEHAIFLVASSFVLFASVLLLMFTLVLATRGVKAHASVFLLIGYAIIVGALFLLTPRFSTLIVGNSVLVMFLETIVMLVGLVLAVAYVGSFLVDAPRRANDVLLRVVLAFSMLYLVAQAVGLTDAYAVRTPIVVLLGAVSLFAVVNVGRALRSAQGDRLRFLVVPGSIFLCFVAAEIVNYQLEFVGEATFLFSGLVLLLVSQFAHAIGYLKAALLQAQRAMELEQELIQSRVSLLLSQIQPHFLFNSLTVIKSLCQTDVKQAELAIDYFSDFLRGDLRSLTNSGTIAFEQELSHVHSYVELERMRFGDRLQVIWDTPVTDFRVPPLTVQPMVENAVRHGVTKRREGGTVRISTREDERAYVVTVRDDGPGFDASDPVQDGRMHVGIDNVRARLAGQCGGTVTVSSIVGGGTTVEMAFPKKERQ